MCGRYTNTAGVQELNERFKVPIASEAGTRRFNIAPTEEARAIHDRMPVILADENAQRAWLDHALGAEEALELCAALPEERLSAAPANPAVNKPGEQPEGPELLVAPPSAQSTRDAPLQLC